MLMFGISSNIRPCIVLHLIALAWHILIVAPVTFAPAGAMTPSAEFLCCTADHNKINKWADTCDNVHLCHPTEPSLFAHMKHRHRGRFGPKSDI